MAIQKTPQQTYIYLRVSTTEQDTRNQAECINDWLTRNGQTAKQTTAEEVSSKTPWRARQLLTLLDMMPPDSTLVVSEISRLARNTLECLEIFREAANRRITIVAVKNSLTMDGSMSSKIISTVLAMAAEIEREMIRARTTEALARKRAAGEKLGRPLGSTSTSKIEHKRTQVEELKRAKISQAGIARMLNVSRNTLRRAEEKWSHQP